MALKSTIFKVSLNVSDLDRHYYGEHLLTLARHPSENDARMMVRLLAFAMHADPRLEFGRGLSAEDEPDLWQRDDTGAILRWIDVGLPDERAVRKACGRAAEVVIVAYGGRVVDMWWAKDGTALARSRNLTVLAVDEQSCTALAALAVRNMALQCTIEDAQMWLTNGSETVLIEPRRLLVP